MALEFQCPNCGSDIVVRFLKAGEVAVCKSCGTESSVPATATELSENGTDKESDFSSGKSNVQSEVLQPINVGRSAWNPARFKWFGFFFSFFPVLVLAAYNWERLGRHEKKKPLLIIAAAAFPVWFALIYMVDSPDAEKVLTALLAALNYGVGKHLETLQSEDYRNFLATGGEKRSYGKPIVNSIFFLIGLIIVFVAVAGS